MEDLRTHEGVGMSTGVITAIVIAVLLVTITLLVLGLSARRRRQGHTTLGLPDLGAISGENAPHDNDAKPGTAPLGTSEHRH
jgi:hypothetical protein